MFPPLGLAVCRLTNAAAPRKWSLFHVHIGYPGCALTSEEKTGLLASGDLQASDAGRAGRHPARGRAEAR
jgi:hypothetical protein